MTIDLNNCYFQGRRVEFSGDAVFEKSQLQLALKQELQGNRVQIGVNSRVCVTLDPFQHITLQEVDSRGNVVRTVQQVSAAAMDIAQRLLHLLQAVAKRTYQSNRTYVPISLSPRSERRSAGMLYASGYPFVETATSRRASVSESLAVSSPSSPQAASFATAYKVPSLGGVVHQPFALPASSFNAVVISPRSSRDLGTNTPPATAREQLQANLKWLIDQNKQLEETLSAAQREIASLIAEKNANAGSSANFEVELQKKQAEITALEQQIAENKAQQTGLGEKVGQLETELSEARKEFEQLEANVQVLSQQLKTANQAQAGLETQLKNNAAEITKLTEELHGKQQEIASLTTTIQELQSNQQQANQQLQEASAKALEDTLQLRQQLEAANKENTEIQQSIESAQKTIAERQELVAQGNTKIAQLEQQINDLRSQINDKAAQAAQLTQDLASANDTLRGAEERARALEQQLTQANESAQSLEAQKQASDSRNVELDMQLNTAQQQIAAHATTIESLQQQLQAAKHEAATNKDQLKMQLQSQQQEVVRAQQNTKIAQKQLEELRQQLRDAQQTSVKAEVTAQQLQQQLDQADLEKAALEKTRDAAAVNAARLETELQSKQAEIAALTKQVAAHEELQARLQNKVETLEAANLQSQQQEAVRAQQNTKTAQKQLEELRQQLRDAQQTSVKAEVTAQQLQQQLDQADLEKAALEKTRDAAAVNAARLETELQSKQAEIAALIKQVAAHEELQARLQDKVEQLEKELDAIKEMLPLLRDGVMAADQAKETLEGELAVYQQKIDEFDTWANAANDDLAELRDENAELRAQLHLIEEADAEHDIASIIPEIEELEIEKRQIESDERRAIALEQQVGMLQQTLNGMVAVKGLEMAAALAPALLRTQQNQKAVERINLDDPVVISNTIAALDLHRVNENRNPRSSGSLSARSARESDAEPDFLTSSTKSVSPDSDSEIIDFETFDPNTTSLDSPSTTVTTEEHSQVLQQLNLTRTALEKVQQQFQQHLTDQRSSISILLTERSNLHAALLKQADEAGKLAKDNSALQRTLEEERIQAESRRQELETQLKLAREQAHQLKDDLDASVESEEEQTLITSNRTRYFTKLAKEYNPPSAELMKPEQLVSYILQQLETEKQKAQDDADFQIESLRNANAEREAQVSMALAEKEAAEKLLNVFVSTAKENPAEFLKVLAERAQIAADQAAATAD